MIQTMRWLRFTAAALALGFALAPAHAQFGRNKISYMQFDWHVYQSPHFDVHYYPEVEPFLEEIVSYAESAYLKISRDLDHELKIRVPLIVYKTHGEFEQTNIILSEVPEGVGAFAEPVQYRMVLPIDQPPDKLYKLIAHELTHIFEYSMFFEGYLGRAFRSNPPTWIMEGLASYLADDEDTLDTMAIRDAVVNGILPPIETLNVVTFLTYRYGNAIFDFIEQQHGPEGLRSFLFEFKKVLLTGNLGRAIKESFGYDLDEFNRRFNRYLRKKYFPVLLEKKSPDEYGTEIGVRKPGVFTFSPTISPSGELVAALASPNLKLDIVVLSAEDGSTVKNLTKGWTNKYQNVVSRAFSGRRDLSWSPSEDRLAAFARKEDKWPLLIFNARSGKLLQTLTLPDIFQIASPAYSPDGRKIAFEGNRNGVVDIFEIDLDTEQIRNLTEDDFYDGNPWYARDGQTLLYNRRIGEHWKLFSVELEDSSRKTQLTFGPFSDIQPAYSPDGERIYFSSDRGPYGVFNIHEMDLATGDVVQYTDVVGGCFSPQEMAERDGEKFLVFQAFFEGTFRLYRMALREPELRIAAADRLVADEVEPFEPDLQLKVDEDEKSRYKLKWDIEAPSFAIGVSNDGTVLSSGAISFTDLLGNHRVVLLANAVADFATTSIQYVNLKRRYNWGGSIVDFRDYFIQATASGVTRREEYAYTALTGFIEYPFNRHYRVTASLGASDTSQTQLNALQQFETFANKFATVSVSLIGDTTRYQSFGPFQGKRFNVGVIYGNQLSGDSAGDFLQYNWDFRTYKQVTRRSLLAWRFAGRYNAGEASGTYGFGGVNQLRGFDYREFAGSRIAWTNLEFRFPLIDELRFPVLRLAQIRGFAFFDLGVAWFEDDLWYDPETFNVRRGFSFWDSENDRLQDGRGSYGVGFQFIFIGGMQFNWAFAHQLSYTELTPTPQKRSGDSRTDFYIVFDW